MDIDSKVKMTDSDIDPLDEIFVDKNKLQDKKLAAEIFRNRVTILDEIFVNKNKPSDKKLLAEILRNKVTIDSQRTIRFTEKLSEKEKILIYLICRKALVARELLNLDDEAVWPTEISKATAVDVNKVKMVLTVFDKLLENNNGKYSIPNRNLRKVKMMIEGE
ncbi:MAG TPA: hypothetical protein VEC16_05740 [Alphaproteobacteria bacterium]|nr:hypothetical protein [Alphaproteobacteria bacterium]